MNNSLDVLEDWLEEAHTSLDDISEGPTGLLERERIQGNIEALEAMIGFINA